MRSRAAAACSLLNAVVSMEASASRQAAPAGRAAGDGPPAELSSDDLSRGELRDRLDAIVADSLRPVCIGVGSLYVAFAVGHLFAVPEHARLLMVALASATATVLLAASAVLRRWSVPSRWAHAAGALVAGLILLNCLLHIHLLSEPLQSTNVALLIVGIGYLFLSSWWFVLALASCIAGWATTAALGPPSPEWIHFGFMLGGAATLGAIVHLVRLQSLRRLEGLRLRDHRHQIELEAINRELEEANQLRSDFVATVSHELRTPLNVILGYATMLSEQAAGSVNDKQKEILAAIQRYSEMQIDLISNVLDFSRLASGKVSVRVERFELEPLLDQIRTLQDEALSRSPVQFTISIAPDIPELETDRVKLHEILHNLIDNAVKFTKAGTVSVEAHTDSQQEAVVIAVSDTGPGIADTELPHVFDAFRQAGQSSTRDTTGVGLGLSIVRGLVSVLGGTVSVASAVGKGTTFRVEIPLRLHAIANGQGDCTRTAQAAA